MIHSTKNSHVKEVQALARPKGRQESGLMALEGVRLIEEAHQAGLQISRAYYTPDLSTRGQALLETLSAEKFLVSPQVMAAMAETQSPQGLLVLAQIPQERELGEGAWLILDALQDPGNLGTLARTALAAGVGGILALPGTVDWTNPKAIRASMGALFRLPVIYPEVEDLPQLLLGRSVLLADAEAQSTYDEVDLTQPFALVLGNEGSGPQTSLPVETLMVSIPLASGVESLNVGVAGAVILFEARRQMKARHTEGRETL